MRRERFGELWATVTGGSDGQGGGDGPLVVLLHGFGAPGYDLVDVGDMLELPAQVRFAFPEAPLTLEDGFGRAWWMLDIELLTRRARGERIDRSDELPPALEAVSRSLRDAMQAMYGSLGATPERTVLGGFSQGSMLACDAALHSDQKPAGLMLLSSTLIARTRWEAGLHGCQAWPVYQSHGVHDPILAFEDAQKLAALWRRAGAALTFVEFRGGHELPPVVLRTASQFLRSTLCKEP